MADWQIQAAKARLSELIKRAVTDGPQRITVRGEPTAVVVSHAEFERLTRPKPRFMDLMRQSPLVGHELDFKREQTFTRDIGLS